MKAILLLATLFLPGCSICGDVYLYSPGGDGMVDKDISTEAGYNP